MTRQEFAELVAQDILVLDGATGSNMIKAGMPRGFCSEDWILENPQPLIDLQRSYVEAGSQIVYAPTSLLQPHRPWKFWSCRSHGGYEP